MLNIKARPELQLSVQISWCRQHQRPVWHNCLTLVKVSDGSVVKASISGTAEMFCHDLEVMSLNLSQVKHGVHGTSVLLELRIAQIQFGLWECKFQLVEHSTICVFPKAYLKNTSA